MCKTSCIVWSFIAEFYLLVLVHCTCNLGNEPPTHTTVGEVDIWCMGNKTNAMPCISFTLQDKDSARGFQKGFGQGWFWAQGRYWRCLSVPAFQLDGCLLLLERRAATFARGLLSWRCKVLHEITASPHISSVSMTKTLPEEL